jgi:SAM-dependent methyltransferase
MTSPVPERVRSAVETLAVQPGDRMLEIGCASGVAAAMICERLVEGQLLAIDRSPVQIERAGRRNEANVASGRLSLQAVALADLDAGNEEFDKVFAINVNPFWLGPRGRRSTPSGARSRREGGCFSSTRRPARSEHATSPSG